jgi:GTP-binding protein
MTLPLIAIVGRPNVGKSTLFNRLIGQRKAIVHDQPGVTRDRHYAEGEWAGHHFTLVDTGGYEVEPESSLFVQMRRQVESAIQEAGLILLIVDGRSGLTSDDREMASKLRRLGKKTVLVVNKIDTAKQEEVLGEFYELGFEKVYPVSAEHGRGVGELLEEIVQNPMSKVISHQTLDLKPETSDSSMIRVAILGRPNVGKSTLLNRLFGAPRAVVHPEPGTTRDTIDVEIKEKNRIFRFIDTAGIRKKSHSEGKIEKVSVLKSFEAVEKSDVVLLLVDAAIGITAQDGKVAQHALKRRRALLILMNKWDAVSKTASWPKVKEDILSRLPTLEFAPIFAVSAKTGLGLSRLFRTIEQVFDEFSKRLTTAQVNKVFRQVVMAHPPPTVSGKSINLFYMTQTYTRPPRFVIFTNHPALIPNTYQRYLVRKFREAFSFQGTPIELEFRARKKKAFHA